MAENIPNVPAGRCSKERNRKVQPKKETFVSIAPSHPHATIKLPTLPRAAPALVRRRLLP